MLHIPVLVKEVLELLDPKENENFIDTTIGEGGHAIEILERTKPFGKLLGIDLDKNQINNSRHNLSESKERIVLVNDSYANLKEIVDRTRFRPISGILLDLGFSSYHVAESSRGFSFLRNEPLDMRYDEANELTAGKIINEYSGQEIERILREFGEEKFSKKISKKIVDQRKVKKIKSTLELVKIIERAFTASFNKNKIHPATRTFQALRIAVNGELSNLKEFLPQAIEVLSKDGGLAIISFHSLEDRMVKNFFKDMEKANQVEILTKKPVTASNEEVLINPRARSAKLRAIVKL